MTLVVKITFYDLYTAHAIVKTVFIPHSLVFVFVKFNIAPNKNEIYSSQTLLKVTDAPIPCGVDCH